MDAFERHRIVVALLVSLLSGTKHTGVYCKIDVCWVIIGDVSDGLCMEMHRVTSVGVRI